MAIRVLFIPVLLLDALPECSWPAPDRAAQLVQLDKNVKTSVGDCTSRSLSSCNGICQWHVELGRCQARLAWFHPTKSGSSFGATLAHFANASLPRAAHMPTCGALAHKGVTGEVVGEEDQCPGGSQGPYEFFIFKYPQHEWFRDVFWDNPVDPDPGNHRTIRDDTYALWKGHFVGLFREPELRVASAFNHFYSRQKPRPPGDHRIALQKFAETNRGTVTKMLCGDNCGWSSKCEFKYMELMKDSSCSGEFCRACSQEPRPEHVEKALSRLEDFAFVGLTSHYDLSVCLFHAMFGGECRAVEFVNMRPGNYEQNYADQLEDYQDPFDGRVFQAASGIFWEKVKQYNLTPEKCSRMCPDSHGDFK